MQPQDLALTMLGTYLREAGQTAWSGGMVELLGEFGFSVDASRAALNRLATRELISRVKVGREVYYRLTPRAEALLDEGDARIFRFGRKQATGRRWTVLWHSLPESHRIERASLATRLRFLGFGSVQDATWLAPHDREKDVLRLLDSLGVAEHAYVFVGRPSAAIDLGAIIEQAWNLDEVTRGYHAFVDELRTYRSARARSRLDPSRAFMVRTSAIHQFRGFPFLDPELPDDLMPEPRLRPAVIDLFDQVFNGLRDPAQRYFETVTRVAQAPTS